MEFWESWGIGKQKRRDDDEGYDKGDKKNEQLEELVVFVVHTLFYFAGQREEEDSLIYFSPPDSCLSHLFSIRTAPLLPPSLRLILLLLLPLHLLSVLLHHPNFTFTRIFLKFHSLGRPIDRGSQLWLLLW